VVGLGDDEEATMAGAGLQEVMLAFDDDLSMPNLAATLLTGVRPRASLLPQRDSQVAPVATLLSDDASDMSGITLDEYRPRLDGHPDDLLINPAASQGSGIRSQESGLEISSGEDKSASIPAEKSGVRNQESGVKITAQAAGKSAISDLLMFGFVTAMMAFKAFRARRLGDPDDPGRPDSRKIEQPSLGARNPKS